MNPTGIRRIAALTIVLVGVFVAALDVLIVNIAFPGFERSFSSARLSELSWVLSAYAITFAALLMPAGRWADRFGRKRAFLSGVAVFTVASAGCAVASSLGMLIGARALQGVGGALLTPSSLGLLLGLFPPSRRGAAIGLWTAIGGAGAGVALPLGGLLVQADWRWVFFVNIPTGIVAVAAGWRLLPEFREKARAATDVLGIVVFAATVAAVVAAIVQGHVWGWGSPRILGLILLGVLGVAFTARRAVRHPAPVIEPAILRIPAVAFGNLATLLFFGGVGALLIGSTLFLTKVWHHSVLRSALEVLPGPVMAMAVAVPSGVLAARHGVRMVGLVGGVLFAAGGVWWAVVPGATPDYAAFLPGSFIGGTGFGLILPCLSAAATLSLPPERFATGAAMTSMCRQVGIALGVAMVTAVLDGDPGVDAYRSAFLIMAAFGLASGFALCAIVRVPRGNTAAVRSPAATQQAA